MKGWLASVAAIALGVRLAALWRDVNDANATLRALRRHPILRGPLH